MGYTRFEFQQLKGSFLRDKRMKITEYLIYDRPLLTPSALFQPWAPAAAADFLEVAGLLRAAAAAADPTGHVEVVAALAMELEMETEIVSTFLSVTSLMTSTAWQPWYWSWMMRLAMEPALRCRSRCTASVAVPSRLQPIWSFLLQIDRESYF